MIFGSKKTLKYNDKGLIPAVVQDANSMDVLMYVYMNHEALKKSRKTRDLWLYHRKEKKVWKKGSKSGRTMRIVDIITHHDRNILLIQVMTKGPACHTGNDTCFYGSYLNDKLSEVQAMEVDELAEDGLEKLRSLFDAEDPAAKPVLEDSTLAESPAREPVVPDETVESFGRPLIDFEEKDDFIGLLEKIRSGLNSTDSLEPNHGFGNMSPERIAQRVGEEAMQLISSVSKTDQNSTVDASARMIHFIMVLLARNEVGPNVFEAKWKEETSRWSRA